jgi:hypothetical protein
MLYEPTMKTNALQWFSLAVLVGWTALAAGAIASLDGEPHFASVVHTHQMPAPREEEAPVLLCDCSPAPGALTQARE